MLNINLRTSADAAVTQAKIAFDMTAAEQVLKLGVLAPDLRASADADVVEAVRRLMAWGAVADRA